MLRKGIPRAPIKADLSAETVRALFTYESETGLLRWRRDQLRGRNHHPGVKAGQIAGTRQPAGYVMVSVKRTLYAAHRLIWLHVHGRWPKEQIDHINGQRDDNRLANLREASPSLNAMNKGIFRNNTSGYPGVTRAPDGQWQAHIWANGKQNYLGTHASAERAYVVYRAVQKILTDGEVVRINQEKRVANA